MKKHYISVAMCTYNGEKYIKEQIESILNQSCAIDELIIGDDGSSDDTIKIIYQTLKNTNIAYKIIENKKNLGYRKNFENVIAQTKGDIIFLSDQDDVWEFEKVKILVEDLDKEENNLLVFSDAYLVDKNLNKLSGSLWQGVYYDEVRGANESWLDLFLKGYYVTGAAMAFKRVVYERAYPFSEIWHHDGWLAICASLYGNVVEEPRKLILYRQHESNQIGANTQNDIQSILVNKVKILKNISLTQKKDRALICERYQELYNRYYDRVENLNESKLKKALEAQELLCTISKKRKMYSLKVIIVCWYKEYYKLYRKRPIGSMIGDVISCWV